MRAALVLALVAWLTGCAVEVGYLELTIRDEAGVFTPSPSRGWWADHDGRLAAVSLAVSANDPYTPVKVRVRPTGAATVTVTRDGARTAPAGAFRLTDGGENYIGTRVPRAFRFGEALGVPAGADLLLEFDPGTVLDDDSVSEGDEIGFDLRVDVGAESEVLPVRLTVEDIDRDWSLRAPFH